MNLPLHNSLNMLYNVIMSLKENGVPVENLKIRMGINMYNKFMAEYYDQGILCLLACDEVLFGVRLEVTDKEPDELHLDINI